MNSRIHVLRDLLRHLLTFTGWRAATLVSLMVLAAISEGLGLLLLVPLLIVGQNHIGQKTEKLIGELSLRPKVKLVGSVPNQRIAEYLRRAHFLLHTSRYESQGVVFNEAMSAGVVVCATRVGLAFDLADGHCVSSDVGDSLRLASEIIDTINDEEHYKKLRSNGRQWCVSHDVMNTVAAYNEIYQRL